MILWHILKNSNISHYSKGDVHLILGRINNDSKELRKAAKEYVLAIDDLEECEKKALIYETLASLNYYREDSFAEASRQWKLCSNYFRSRIDRELSEGKEPELSFAISPLPSEPEYVFPDSTTKIIIGKSKIEVKKGDVLVSQADRVSRDWLSCQIASEPWNNSRILRIFSERLTWPSEEQHREVGWHEGGRIYELRKTGLRHVVATGTVIAKKGDKWYAPNDKGVFMFDVPYDKIAYPTTRFLTDNIVVVIDTHGINMLVRQAIRNNATIVVGCCDNVGKIKAAKYLAERGINSVCFTDKYLPLILGHNLSILGSPPVKWVGGRIILGDQPIEINLSEKIVVQDVNPTKFAISYYKTPAFYFKQLSKMMQMPLNIEFVEITDFNQMDKVVKEAENVIAVRVYNKDDYETVRRWLKENKKHKAVLFHSSSYPYGYMIFREFPDQTSFDDIYPQPAEDGADES